MANNNHRPSGRTPNTRTQPNEDAREDEHRAILLLQDLLGSTGFTRRDGGGAQGMHDFDLHLPDGRTFAVEVTSDQSQVDIAFWKQIEQMDPLQAPGLKHSWRVELFSPGTDHTDQSAAGERSKALQKELASILAEVESLGLCDEIKQICLNRRYGEPDVVGRLRDLGVRRASHLTNSADDTQIILREANHFGFTSRNTLGTVVRDHLSYNRDKLTKAKHDDSADEVHLFIWLSIGQQHRAARTAGLSLVDLDGSDCLEPVDLQGVDAVWLALDPGHEQPYLDSILCCDRDGWHAYTSAALAQPTVGSPATHDRATTIVRSLNERTKRSDNCR